MNKPIKILYLQLLPILSGVQNFNLHLIDGLNPDFEISLASHPGAALENALQARGIKHIPLPYLKREISLWDIPALLHLIYIIRKHRFDIVHTNSSKPGLLGRLAATLCGVKRIIHTSHGSPFQDDQSRFVNLLYRFFEALANLMCLHVVFVNHSDRKRYIALHLIKPSKASTIYNALPPQKQEIFEAIASQRKHLQDGWITIGSSLRFSDQKNILTQISSACRVCHQNEKIRFIFVGDGEHYELCKSIIYSHDLNTRILLPGWDESIDKWLQIFDIFLLYSRWEALPISIIEAMHSGLAVIGSDLPGIMELVDESCGYIVPLSNPSLLEHCILELAKDPPILIEKGKQAQIQIREKCSYPQMISTYESLYYGISK